MTDRPAGTPDEPTPELPAGEPDPGTDPAAGPVDDEIVEAETEDLAAGDDELGVADADDEVVEAEAAAAAGTAAGGVVATDALGPTGRRGRTAAAPTARPATPSEQAVRVRDNISKWFVAITAIVFALILLNGVLLGRNGVFSPGAQPSESPAVSGSPSVEPSVSPAASGSAAPSSSPGSSGTGSPSASAAASASPAP